MTRLTARTWGPDYHQARQLYLACVRSVMVYGAPYTHTPTVGDSGPRGFAKALEAKQNACLRIVTGAYKATPTYMLEVEANTPPLDIYLNKSRARFEGDIDYGEGGNWVVDRAVEKIRLRFGTGAQPGTKTRLEREREDLRKWEEDTKTRGTYEALFQSWKERVEDKEGKRRARLDRRRREEEQEGREHLPGPQWLGPRLFKGKRPWITLKKYAQEHDFLRKAESSALVQARTGKLGLKAFLFQRKVPDIATPLCDCGGAPETVGHLLRGCEARGEGLEALKEQFGPTGALFRRITTGKGARPIIRWLMERLPEYKVAREIKRQQDERQEDAEARPRGGEG